MTETPTHTDRLAAIRARVEAATAGPWWQGSWRQPSAPEGAKVELSALLCYFDDEKYPRFWNWHTDGEFVAHARQDVPWLLAEVERLTAENAAARELVIAWMRSEDAMAAALRGEPLHENVTLHHAMMDDIHEAKWDAYRTLKAMMLDALEPPPAPHAREDA